MKIWIILNRDAGSYQSDHQEVSEALNDLRDNSGKINAELKSVEGAQLQETARQALSAGVERIVAAGGDGTINAVAGVLQGTQAALGVIPLGTFNNFARDNHIPLDISKAMRTVFEGRIKEIDVGEVNGHIFLNNSSVGFYPNSVRIRDKTQRIGYRKIPAMIYAMFRIFTRFPLLRVHLTNHQFKEEVVTPFVFIGNNHYQLDLLTFGSRDRLDGGRLSIYYPECRNRFSLVRLVFLTLFNRLKQDRQFVNFSTTEIDLHRHGRRTAVAMDGEVIHLHPPLRYRLRPRSLRIILPQNA